MNQACARLSVSGVTIEKGGEWNIAGISLGKKRAGKAFKHCFKYLIPKYQLLWLANFDSLQFTPIT